ncbi:MAG: response regulator [Anaerolineales bacterium]|nr:response regulator [Anaerolineales bacterium]
MERIRAAQPAAIILDILLHDGSGWDILRQLKADPVTGAIPVIVISVIDDRPKALQLGAVEHILKPVSRSDLQLALNTARRVVDTDRHEPVMVVSGNPDRETILLAEDHEISRLLVSDFLTAQGYVIVTAQNGNEALQLLQEVCPALILMDIQMPGMDGLEVIHTVRGLKEPGLAGVPIIALTALSMPGDRERCLAMGADLYLSKPVDFKELAVSIRTLLDRGDLTGARVASEG